MHEAASSPTTTRRGFLATSAGLRLIHDRQPAEAFGALAVFRSINTILAARAARAAFIAIEGRGDFFRDEPQQRTPEAF